MYRDLDEQELARLCVQRDCLAEDELYRRYAARLFTLCRRYSDDSDTAKDLMQDTFVKALGKIQDYTYRGKGSLFSWLSRIAVNLAINNINRHAVRYLPLKTFASDRFQEPQEEAVLKIPPEEMMKMITSLPRLQRTVFNMYCMEEMSHKEIAEAIGVSERGSASLLSKARMRLKKQVGLYLKKSE